MGKLAQKLGGQSQSQIVGKSTKAPATKTCCNEKKTCAPMKGNK